MKNLYKEIFKASIKVGDMVCITREGDGNDEMFQGQISEILPNQLGGVRVEIILENSDKEILVKEVGFVEYVIRENGIEYGSLR